MDQSEITLIVKAQDGDQIFFRIKRHIQLSKLMTAYCKKKQLDYDVMVFIYDSKRINKKQTPESLKMEDGDEIYAFMHQGGGGSHATNMAA